eukprot:5477152-Pyramimonas_sp.AAC.1
MLPCTACNAIGSAEISDASAMQGGSADVSDASAMRQRCHRAVRSASGSGSLRSVMVPGPEVEPLRVQPVISR